MEAEPIRWEGHELRTMGETMAIIAEIAKSGDKARAAAFVEAYEKTTSPEIVRVNIGYCSGYYDDETAQKIFEVFGVRHPFFGTTKPDPQWAFELGYRRARGGRP